MRSCRSHMKGATFGAPETQDHLRIPPTLILRAGPSAQLLGFPIPCPKDLHRGDKKAVGHHTPPVLPRRTPRDPRCSCKLPSPGIRVPQALTRENRLQFPAQRGAHGAQPAPGPTGEPGSPRAGHPQGLLRSHSTCWGGGEGRGHRIGPPALRNVENLPSLRRRGGKGTEDLQKRAGGRKRALPPRPRPSATYKGGKKRHTHTPPSAPQARGERGKRPPLRPEGMRPAPHPRPSTSTAEMGEKDEPCPPPQTPEPPQPGPPPTPLPSSRDLRCPHPLSTLSPLTVSLRGETPPSARSGPHLLSASRRRWRLRQLQRGPPPGPERRPGSGSRSPTPPARGARPSVSVQSPARPPSPPGAALSAAAPAVRKSPLQFPQQRTDSGVAFPSAEPRSTALQPDEVGEGEERTAGRLSLRHLRRAARRGGATGRSR